MKEESEKAETEEQRGLLMGLAALCCSGRCSLAQSCCGTGSAADPCQISAADNCIFVEELSLNPEEETWGQEKEEQLGNLE